MNDRAFMDEARRIAAADGWKLETALPREVDGHRMVYVELIRPDGMVSATGRNIVAAVEVAVGGGA
jgi:hypothetical protein